MNEKKLQDWYHKRANRKALYEPEHLFDLIRSGDSAALSRAITLVESTKKEDKLAAQDLIRRCLPFSGTSIRIGITGVPGVGKSTFIESFGLEWITQGKKVAVLAIDPSSEKTGGSILGDKTRMEKLSAHASAFIRPSAAGDSLGGVARKTRESIFLCEAAGYELILVETVGVGQSETSVHSMVDFFLLLMLAGAGDELQGIKRGIMEMADLLVVTKADGENVNAAKTAQRVYQNAMHVFPPNPNNWTPKSMTCSSFREEDVRKIREVIEHFRDQMRLNGYFSEHRKQQDSYWVDESLKELILSGFFSKVGVKDELFNLKQQVLKGEISSFEAADLIFKQFKGN